MARIAFIGLGKMGLGMAGRLLAAGHQLRVYNRTPEKAAPLMGAGAWLCATPGEACGSADVVISMVADDAASRAVWLGEEGVLAAMAARAGAFAIECSTLSHEWVSELSAAARSCGLRYIDAPVTGLPDNAVAGDLTLLVGADPAGLDLQVVADAIATGQAASPQVVRNTRRMVEGTRNPNITFTPRLRLKDVDYAQRLARQLGLGTPFGALAARAFGQLCDTGRADENESIVIDIARHERPSAG